MSPALSETMAALRHSSDVLVEAVTDLTHRVNVAEETQRKLRRAQRLLIMILLVLVLLAGVSFGVLLKAQSNSNRIDEIQHRTSDQVLCPLYRLFLAAIARPDPKAGDSDGDGVVSPEEREAREEAVEVITEGYQVLEC